MFRQSETRPLARRGPLCSPLCRQLAGFADRVRAVAEVAHRLNEAPPQGQGVKPRCAPADSRTVLRKFPLARTRAKGQNIVCMPLDSAPCCWAELHRCRANSESNIRESRRKAMNQDESRLWATPLLTPSPLPTPPKAIGIVKTARRNQHR